MNIQRVSFWQWFRKTWILVLKSHQEFWASFEGQEFTNRVLWFGLLTLSFGLGLEVLFQVSMIDLTQSALLSNEKLPLELAELMGIEPDKFPEVFLNQMVLLKKQNILTIFVFPVFGYFFIYLYSGGLHGLMRFFGHISAEKKISYETTLSIVCFSLAPAVFLVVPIIGPMIVTVWFLLLVSRGIMQVYSLNFFQTFFLVLTPGFIIKLFWTQSLTWMALSVPNHYFEKPLVMALKEFFNT